MMRHTRTRGSFTSLSAERSGAGVSSRIYAHIHSPCERRLTAGMLGYYHGRLEVSLLTTLQNVTGQVTYRPIGLLPLCIGLFVAEYNAVNR